METKVASASRRTDVVGIYVRIPRGYAEDVRKDATSLKTSVDAVASAIFKNHFLFKVDERKLRYGHLPIKRRGRKVAS